MFKVKLKEDKIKTLEIKNKNEQIAKIKVFEGWIITKNND